jgi:hypothetical protein
MGKKRAKAKGKGGRPSGTYSLRCRDRDSGHPFLLLKEWSALLAHRRSSVGRESVSVVNLDPRWECNVMAIDILQRIRERSY